MKVLVLGAGVIGTSTAWYLTEQGHDFTASQREIHVIERFYAGKEFT